MECPQFERGFMAPLTIDIEQEDDGRWIAEIPQLPGVMAYGENRQEAIDRVQALSLRVLADRIEHGEPVPEMDDVFSVSS
jgi:predicted RNase H-like HicB family nuclease